MATKLELWDDAVIVRLEGELDHHYAAQLRREIDSHVTKNHLHKVIFDFSRVGFMDSSGIGVLMGRYRLMQSVGGSVCAFGINKRLDKLIEMSGVRRIISIYATEAEAKEDVTCLTKTK